MRRTTRATADLALDELPKIADIYYVERDDARGAAGRVLNLSLLKFLC